jgi:N-methylhydantoinase A
MQRLGVDVGGTFTDIVVLDEDRGLTILKVLSTPSDYSEAICVALEQLIQRGELRPLDVAAVIHAYTVASNTVITRSGARVGLITTEGFRDVLEIGRLRMPRLYDMEWEKPRPLVPRYLRREVRERTDFRGRIVTPLDEAGTLQAVETLLARGVDSIAVCLLNAYVNPVHEQRIVEIIQARAPQINLSVSHRVLPEIREYERTSTTVINAYVKPVVQRYLENLGRRLTHMGIKAPLMVMQSAGGTMKAEMARERPVHSIESGPAAGAVGAATMGQRLGVPDIIAFDMGGTTAKLCLIEDGEPRLASELEVGSGISIGHRLLKGGGYLVRTPAIDLAEIGAGGGSIAWIDKGGALRVGPHSAGADPGPACYLRGGAEPSVTDANVVLGYLSSSYLLGGELAIDAAPGRKAIYERIAAPLRLSLEEAAFGIHTIVNSNMVRAVQAVSSEIGRDPRDFTLFAFGGCGPVHAASLAVQAKIPRVIVPPAPGVFSAMGLLFTTVEHRYVQTFWRDVAEADLEALNGVLRRLDQEAVETLAAEGFAPEDMELQHLVDLRYAGQSSEITIPADPGPITPQVVQALVQAFHHQHERTYGYRSREEEPVQFVNLRLRAGGHARDQKDPQAVPLTPAGRRSATPLPPTVRKAYFGPDHGWVETPIIPRIGLDRSGLPGPLIVEEYDTTVVVLPGATAALDDANNIRVDVAALL